VTIAQLSRARELTREQKERGWLREPSRWKVVECKIGDNVVRGVVRTKASLRAPADFNDIPPDVLSWASNRSLPLSPKRLTSRRRLIGVSVRGSTRLTG